MYYLVLIMMINLPAIVYLIFHKKWFSNPFHTQWFSIPKSTSHTEEAKKLIEKSERNVNKIVESMDKKIAKLNKIYHQIDVQLDLEAQRAKDKALAQAKAGGYEIEFTTDIERLKQGSIGKPQLFFDMPNATPEQKKAYQAYLDSEPSGGQNITQTPPRKPKALGSSEPKQRYSL